MSATARPPYVGFSSDTPLGARPADLLQVWKNLMQRAVDAARGQESDAAQALLLRALPLARALLLAAPASGDVPADDRVAAWVVTHLNLADLLADAGCLGVARARLCEAHQVLSGLLRDDRAALELRQAALRHSRETRSALLTFLSAHGPSPEIVQALAERPLPYPPCGTTLH